MLQCRDSMQRRCLNLSLVSYLWAKPPVWCSSQPWQKGGFICAGSPHGTATELSTRRADGLNWASPAALSQSATSRMICSAIAAVSHYSTKHWTQQRSISLCYFSCSDKECKEWKVNLPPAQTGCCRQQGLCMELSEKYAGITEGEEKYPSAARRWTQPPDINP